MGKGQKFNIFLPTPIKNFVVLDLLQLRRKGFILYNNIKMKKSWLRH